jgi:uncharacterized protein YPO0396
MTRTIRLTRLHAINWYGYQESIAVDGNLLLAGVTGSGKSILMDLIQFVLVGDLRLVRFNQSATGGHSDRTLKSYCLGDTKQEENGVTQYMRASAITYAALEFTWPEDNRVETWGFRVEFSSAAENQGKVTPFFIPEKLSRADFVSSDHRPLDYTAFKALASKQEGRLYSEGLEAYLRDMAQPTHLNFDRDILRSLLPTAMSFTFLKSFNDFCRQFILASGRLDVTDVTASYRSFLAYERELKDLNEEYQQLQKIHDQYERLAVLRRDKALARYLEAQLSFEASEENLRELERALVGLRQKCAAEEARLAELQHLSENAQSRLEQITSVINETSEGRLYNRIRRENQDLAREISDLSGIGKTVEEALSKRVCNARGWLDALRKLPLDVPSPLPRKVETVLAQVESGGPSHATETLQALAGAAQNAMAEINRLASPNQKRLAEIRSDLGQLRDQIRALQLGKLPFPTTLLDALNHRLPQDGPNLHARMLCQLCEVNDEYWREAIEVAFTRKFAIVVSEADYVAAEQIYHELKRSPADRDTARESLINPFKALKLRKEAQPGSLAQKLDTSHPVARIIIDSLFGDLICVKEREELGQYHSAILPDGFMTRGAFVERPRFYDGNPFVGDRGIQQQLEWKRNQVTELEAEIRQLEPLEREVKELGEQWSVLFEISPDLTRDLARGARLPELQAKLDQNIGDLNKIDRAKFDELEKERTDLEKNREDWNREIRDIDRSPVRNSIKQSEKQFEEAKSETAKRKEAFDQVLNETDVSPWQKQLAEQRERILTEFPVKKTAAEKLMAKYHESDRDEVKASAELRGLRSELAIRYPKFDDLAQDSANNDAYDRHLNKLKESEIPEYSQKAKRERQNWESLFRTQVLEKLHEALQGVRDNLSLLNTSLKQRPIGNQSYQIRSWQNPDFKIYHELAEASSLARSDELFFASAEPRFRDAIQRFLLLLTAEPDSAEATRLLDYRHYYEYEMDVIEPDGRKSSVDKHSGKYSGGENQSPYFIAILASYLRAYRRYSPRNRQSPSLGLVPIDEAFSKLSGERIKDCITALKAFDLQGVLSMSTGNIPYAFEHCDWLVIVSKEEKQLGKKTEIRNIPVSLSRTSEEAEELMNF